MYYVQLETKKERIHFILLVVEHSPWRLPEQLSSARGCGQSACGWASHQSGTSESDHHPVWLASVAQSAIENPAARLTRAIRASFVLSDSLPTEIIRYYLLLILRT
jgi:hypothetical protein